VSTSADLGDVTAVVLMSLAGALLVGLLLAPPLLARASANRRVRHEQAEE